MLKLAGREGDGAIINWLSAEDVATVAPIVQDASPDGSPREVVARIFCAPIDDPATAYGAAKFAIAAYMKVPVYRAFPEWAGRYPFPPMSAPTGTARRFEHECSIQ